MLSNLFSRLQNEKGYVLTALILCLIYVGAGISGKNHAKQTTPRDETVLTDFESREKNLSQQLSTPEGSRKFFQEHPDAAMAFQGMVLLWVVILFAGASLILMFVFRPKTRNWFLPLKTDESTPWSLGLLLKALIWILSANIGVEGILFFLKHGHWLIVSHDAMMLIHTLLINFISLIVLCQLVLKQQGNLRDLGFRLVSQSILSEIRFSLMAYVSLLPMFLFSIAVVYAMSKVLALKPDSHALVHVFLNPETSPGLIATALLLAFILAPAMEELFFRGFCYPIFKAKFGRIGGMMLSAAIFAGVHMSWFAFLPIFILGLGLTLVYETRKSLITPIIFHSLHNSLFVGSFFIVKSLVQS